MKHDYTEFDVKLLGLIRAGTVTAMALTIALEDDAAEFRNTSSPMPCPAYRVVDKRLQALRKAVKIKVNRHKTNSWQAVE